MPALVLEDENGSHRLELALNEGRRYRTVVGRPTLKAQLLSKLDALAPIGVVAGAGGLIGNLNVWENLALPITYAGGASVDELETRAEALFRRFGILHARFADICASLPDRLTSFERRLAVFV